MLSLIGSKFKIFINRFINLSNQDKLINIFVISLLFSAIFLVNTFIINYFNLKTYNYKTILYLVFGFTFVIGLSKQVFDTFSLFFESNDRDLLFCTPIPIRTILMFRTLQLLGSSLSIYFILFIPFVFSYGLSIGTSFAYYIICLFSLIAFMLLLISFVQVIVLIIIRYAPKQYKKESIYFFMGFISLITFITTIFFKDIKLFEHIYFFQKFIHFAISPFAFFIDSIVSFTNRNYIQSYKSFSSLLFFSIISFIVSTLLMKKFFYLGWFLDYDKGKSFLFHRKVILKKEKVRFFKYGFLDSYPILIKDLKYFTRDIEKWKFVLFPIMLLVLYSIKYDFGSNIALYIADLNIFAFYTAVGISFSSITYEKDCYFLLKSSPISFKNVFISKFWNSVILTTTFIQIINIIITLVFRINILTSLFISVCCTLLILTVCSTANYFGMKYLTFDSDSKLIVQPLGFLYFVSLSFIKILFIALFLFFSFLFIYNQSIAKLFDINFLWLKYLISLTFGLTALFVCIIFTVMTFKKTKLLEYPE